MRMDYKNVDNCSTEKSYLQERESMLKNKRKVFFISLLISMIFAFLFYRSILGILCFPIIFWIISTREKNLTKMRQNQKLLEEFVNGIRVLNGSLQAGLSMENAWIEVQKELLIMYGECGLFYKEVKEINHSVALNVPIEKLLLNFAYRSGLEDIIVFAELFEYGKRSGGNWKRIIQDVVQHIQDKYDAQKEIEVMIASKKLEQQVLNVMPLGILLFLQISSWEYLSVLYHNPTGIFCMTICLLGYGMAFLLSEKILDIQV